MRKNQPETGYVVVNRNRTRMRIGCLEWVLRSSVRPRPKLGGGDEIYQTSSSVVSALEQFVSTVSALAQEAQDPWSTGQPLVNALGKAWYAFKDSLK